MAPYSCLLATISKKFLNYLLRGPKMLKTPNLKIEFISLLQSFDIYFKNKYIIRYTFRNNGCIFLLNFFHSKSKMLISSDNLDPIPT